MYGTVSLGEPTHYVTCNRCDRIVGGPYFDPAEASERAKEHKRNRHDPYRAYAIYRRDPDKPKAFRLPGTKYL